MNYTFSNFCEEVQKSLSKEISLDTVKLVINQLVENLLKDFKA